jgi:hypothetical protein
MCPVKSSKINHELSSGNRNKDSLYPANYDRDIESLSLEVKTRQEVADEYGISLKTLRLRLINEKINIPPGRLYPKTLRIIYNTLGRPGRLKTI